MLKSYVSFARILMKNSFTALNTNVRISARIRSWEYRYASDCGPHSSTPLQDEERKRKIVTAELNYMVESGFEAPDPAALRSVDWEHLITLKTLSARNKYYRFLFLRTEAIKQQRERQATRKAERKNLLEERKNLLEERPHNPHIQYGLGENSLFMRIRPQTIARWKNRKLWGARLYGQKLIFDCSFDASMSHHEIQSAGRQLSFCFANNRAHRKPFDIHLCNMNPDSKTLKCLQKYIPNVSDQTFPLSIHQKCFTELFPIERLVYLSPDSENVLTDFNGDDIFIVGTIVDKGPCERLSLAKAKSLGVRHARLPIDNYVHLAPGVSKRFNFMTMTDILQKWKETRDWAKAFSKIPWRKLADPPNE